MTAGKTVDGSDEDGDYVENDATRTTGITGIIIMQPSKRLKCTQNLLLTRAIMTRNDRLKGKKVKLEPVRKVQIT